MSESRHSDNPTISTSMYSLSALLDSAITRRGVTLRFCSRSRTRTNAPGSDSATTRKRSSATASDPAFSSLNSSTLMRLLPRTDFHHNERANVPAFRESRATNALDVVYEVFHGIAAIIARGRVSTRAARRLGEKWPAAQ